MVDGAHLEIDRLEAAKRALDMGEPLVGADDFGRGQPGRVDRGADDVESIEGGFTGDAGFVALVPEARVGDLEREVLADLAASEDPAHPQGDPGAAAERAPPALRGRRDRGELPFGRVEQFATLARPVLR